MTKLRDGYFRQINSKVGDDNYLLKAQGGYIGLHTGRNNEANKVVRTDENGYIQAGWINTTSGSMDGNTPARIYASYDGYIRYMTPGYFFSNLSNSGNNISITVGGQNRTLTVGYADNAEAANYLNGYTKIITVNGDINTYYPVRIPNTTRKSLINTISVWRNLGLKSAIYPGSHGSYTTGNGGGVSCWYEFVGRYNGWDGNGGYYYTRRAWYAYDRQLSHAAAPGSAVGDLFVWLRGGGTEYYVSTNYPFSDPVVYYERTNASGSSQYPSWVEPRTDIGNEGILTNTYYGNIIGNANTASGLSVTHYWANVAISTSPKTNTTPTFGGVTIYDGTNSCLYLKTTSTGAYAYLAAFNTGGQYGADVVLHSGSAMVLGAGESAAAMYSNNIDSLRGSENLYLTADGSVKIFTNCDSIGNRKQVVHFDTSGYTYFGSYINIGGHEKNASSPTYVWGSNNSDNFLRSYQTSSLSVGSAYTLSSFAESSGTEDRYVWHSWSDNSAKVAYNSGLMFNPNNKLLKIKDSSGFVHIGNGYIKIRKESPANPTANYCSIEFSYSGGQEVYLGYTPNDSYRVSKGLKVWGSSSDNGNCWFEVEGQTYANGFNKHGSSNSYVLLGGGGHKLESSLSVNYADSAGSVAWANITGKPFNWSGQSGQPTWLWGSNDGTNYYVWNPSNFSVNYANSAGNADTVDNMHASDFSYNVSSGNYDCNNLPYGTHSATYRFGGSPLNAFPNSSWSNMFVIGAGSDTMTQIGAPYDADELYFRRGTWYSDGGSIRTNEWRAILHSGNYTSYVNNYYWANVKISTSSNTGTYPTFANMKSTGRVYLDEWIQFSGSSGLYWPNTNGAHLYANTTTSYAALITQGSRGGYCGLQCGPSANYMTVMSTDTHHGLYCENTGTWEFYYNRSNGNVGIRTSSNLGYDINLNGSVGSNSSISGVGFVHTSYNSASYLLTSNGGVVNESKYLKNFGSSNYVTFTVGGDANTYYPVRIHNPADYYPYSFITISRAYWETAPDTWYTSTHKGGLSMCLFWNSSCYWDGNSSGEECFCVRLNETYCNMVAGMDKIIDGTVVWLRGGGATYHIHGIAGTSQGVTVYLESYTDHASRTFSPRTWEQRTPVSVRWPGYANGADYASSAGSVAWGNVTGKPFNWSGQSGQPTWLWGSNDGTNYYVWNPSNFSVNYANSAGNAGSANGLASTGYGNGNLTYYQTSNSFFDNSGWCHYIIANHGDGSSYYNFTIGLPFWGVPIYKRLKDGTGDGWHTFITSENIGSQSVNYADSAGYADNANKLDNIDSTGFLAWTGMSASGGSSAPFQTSVDFFNNTANLNAGARMIYNYPGSEYTILYTRRSDDVGHGTILRWGYPDNYIRMIRMISGSPQTSDWEKISAGYADSAGDADKLDGYHANDFATAGHTHDGRYLRYEGWWSSGSGQNVDNANGMTFVYGDHGSPNGWGILCTFDYTYNSDYKFQLFAEGYSASGMYYRCRSSDRGGWTSWKTVIDDGNIGSQSVNYANYSEYSTRLDGGAIAGWGTLTSSNGFSGIAAYDWEDKGAFCWAGKSDKMYMQVDGWFYQNEGQYRVLDTSDAGSLSVNYANYAGYLTAYTSSTGGTGANKLYLWNDWNNTGSLGTYFHGIWVGSPDGNIGYDLAYLHGDKTHLYMRSYDYGTWNSWYKICTNADTYVASDGTNRGIIDGSEVASVRHLLINGVTWNSDWHWSGQSGQPSWLWGSNDGVNMYVWDPSNFSVNYADSAGSASSSTYARYLNCPDTRSSASAPGDYTATSTGVSFDFKESSVTGLSGYSGVMTVRPYGSAQDWSGGEAHQIAFLAGGGLYHRIGTSSWGSWERILTSSNWSSYISIPSVGNGTVTITQAGSTIGSFTMNQSGNTLIALNDTNTNYYPIRSYTSGLQISSYSGSTDCALFVPYATANQAGVVSTETQTFSGQKTFSSIRLRSTDTVNFGGYLYFGDGSYAYLAELADDQLTLNASKIFLGISGNQKYYIDGTIFRPVTANSTSSSGIALGSSDYRFTCGYFSDKVYAYKGFYESSDERLKRILNSVKVNLDDLSKLRKVYYLWKDRTEDGIQLGMIAQDVQRLYPELVSVDKETGYLSLAYDKLSVLALEAIDVLYKEHKKLKKHVDELEKLLINNKIY